MGVQVALLCSHCPSSAHRMHVCSVAVRAHSYPNILCVVSNGLVLGKLSQRVVHDHIPETFATFQTGITHIKLCCSHLFRAFNHLFKNRVCNVSGLANDISGLVYPFVKGSKVNRVKHLIQGVNWMISAQYLFIRCFPIKGWGTCRLFVDSHLYCSSFTSSVCSLITSRQKKKTTIRSSGQIQTSTLRNWDGTSQPKQGENPSDASGWKKIPWLFPVRLTGAGVAATAAELKKILFIIHLWINRSKERVLWGWR